MFERLFDSLPKLVSQPKQPTQLSQVAAKLDKLAMKQTTFNLLRMSLCLLNRVALRHDGMRTTQWVSRHMSQGAPRRLAAPPRCHPPHLF
jgi:hypothetical protein